MREKTPNYFCSHLFKHMYICHLTILFWPTTQDFGASNFFPFLLLLLAECDPCRQREMVDHCHSCSASCAIIEHKSKGGLWEIQRCCNSSYFEGSRISTSIFPGNTHFVKPIFTHSVGSYWISCSIEKGKERPLAGSITMNLKEIQLYSFSKQPNHFAGNQEDQQTLHWSGCNCSKTSCLQTSSYFEALYKWSYSCLWEISWVCYSVPSPGIFFIFFIFLSFAFFFFYYFCSSLEGFFLHFISVNWVDFIVFSLFWMLWA